MGFRTKIDYSSNRQIQQFEKTSTDLSGKTNFGLPFSALTTGPSPSDSGVTNVFNDLVYTFSGNASETVFNFPDNNMGIAVSTLNVIDLTDIGNSFDTGNFFVGINPVTIDGNVVYLDYSGVSFDVNITDVQEPTSGIFTGSAMTGTLLYLSANTLDYLDRLIWVDVDGITKTKDLIITDNAQTGYVWTCLDVDGNGGWLPSSGSSSGITDTFVSGGSFNSGTLTLNRTDGNDVNVSGITVDTFWSAGTGTEAISAKNHNSSASGDYNLVYGLLNTVNGANNSILGGSVNTILDGGSSNANVIIGGRTNNIEGNNLYSVILGGSSNIINTGVSESVILGSNSITADENRTIFYENSKSSGSDKKIKNSTEYTLDQLTQQTLNNTPTTATTINGNTNGIITIDVQVSALANDYSAGYGGQFFGVFRSSGGTMTEIDSYDAFEKCDFSPIGDCPEFSLNAIGNNLHLVIQGSSASTVDWQITYKYQKR